MFIIFCMQSLQTGMPFGRWIIFPAFEEDRLQREQNSSVPASSSDRLFSLLFRISFILLFFLPVCPVLYRSVPYGIC